MLDRILFVLAVTALLCAALAFVVPLLTGVALIILAIIVLIHTL